MCGWVHVTSMSWERDPSSVALPDVFFFIFFSVVLLLLLFFFLSQIVSLNTGDVIHSTDCKAL